VLPSFEFPYPITENAKSRIYVLHVYALELVGKPIASILVEHVEKFVRDSNGLIVEASVRIHYELITRSRNYHRQPGGDFSGCYFRNFEGNERVSITSPSMSTGAVFLDLPGLEGCRIGTYLMNEIASWVKQWPDADLKPIGLLAGQADSENKERRNRFYQQFGIEFEFTNSFQTEGFSKPMCAGQLINSEKWKSRIKVIDAREYLANILDENLNFEFEVENLRRAKSEAQEDYKKAARHPVIFMLQRLWFKYNEELLTTSFFGFIGWIVYFKYFQ
jgi:hypothetical protein